MLCTTCSVYRHILTPIELRAQYMVSLIICLLQLIAGQEVVGVATTAAGPRGDHDNRPNNRTAREKTAARATKVLYCAYRVQYFYPYYLPPIHTVLAVPHHSGFVLCWKIPTPTS